MTEKQPDWIDNLIEKYKEEIKDCDSHMDGSHRVQAARYKKIYEEFIKDLQTLHQESTYESGYQKGRDDNKKKYIFKDEPQQNEVQELKVCPDCLWSWKMSYWYLVNPIRLNEFECPICKYEREKLEENEAQKTQEEITADEQMGINEMINEESPSEDNLVENILEDISKLCWPLWELYDPIKSILKKHLSSK